VIIHLANKIKESFYELREREREREKRERERKLKLKYIEKAFEIRQCNMLAVGAGTIKLTIFKQFFLYSGRKRLRVTLFV
jgi:hypothetical protein